MNSLELIKKEIEELGYQTKLTANLFNNTSVLTFDYTPSLGRYKNQKFKMGISMQEDGYPEHPPHFLHICNLPASHLTIHGKYKTGDESWEVFSAPPKDIWDHSPMEEKNMKIYMYSHIARVWDTI